MASVIFGDDEDAKTVMDYQPKKLSLGITKAAQNFVVSQPQEAASSSFRISELVAQQTGIQELEKASIEKRIEQKALERLKEIQESAYREAYNIGLEEGRLKGYEEAKDAITERMQHMNDLIERLSRIKVDILQRNEIQIVDMVFYLASKVAHFEIEKNSERILPVLKSMRALIVAISLSHPQSQPASTPSAYLDHILSMQHLTKQELNILIVFV